MSFLNLQTQNRFVATNFTFNSTSFTNWLDAPGGNTCAVTITKAYGDSDIFIRAQMRGRVATATTAVFVGVNDGTSDYLIGGNVYFSSSGQSIMATGGIIKIAGLSAGTYTFTLRVKVGAANTFTCATSESAFITAYEANGSTGYVADTVNATTASAVTLSSTVYADLKDSAGNSITLTFTKASGSSLLLVRESISFWSASATSMQLELAVGIGGVDTKTCRSGDSNVSIRWMNGQVAIPSIAAGSTTLTMRYKRTTANGSWPQTNNTASMSVIELEPT